jgi:hypothetical protein
LKPFAFEGGIGDDLDLAPESLLESAQSIAAGAPNGESTSCAAIFGPGWA